MSSSIAMFEDLVKLQLPMLIVTCFTFLIGLILSIYFWLKKNKIQEGEKA